MIFNRASSAQCVEDGRPQQAVLLVAGLATVWTLGAFLIPLLEAWGYYGAGVFRFLYQPLCHQDPERSLHLGGWAIAVCTRCTGLYIGGSAGLLWTALFLMARGRRIPHAGWLLIVAAPNLLDVAARFSGWPGLPNLPRLVIALPAGLVVGLLLGAGVADSRRLASEKRRARAFPKILEHPTCCGPGMVNHSN